MQEPSFQRIISLVPSQTELLYDLGLGERVVGITKFCVHPPEWFQSKKRVGGTKTVDIQKVAALYPDLVIANKEENDRDQVLAIEQFCRVWVSDVKTLEDALEMIRTIGDRTQTAPAAAGIIQRIETKFQQITPHQPPRRAAYLIWRKPFMAAGGDTFIHDMIQREGYINVFADQQRYPQTDAATLAQLAPEEILLSSEPFPFAQKHIAELQEICPKAQIRLVDGERYSWYGSRLCY
jgi:ABC-type Fe3+-hydroxamate transport system substrate-binding protein